MYVSLIICVSVRLCVDVYTEESVRLFPRYTWEIPEVCLLQRTILVKELYLNLYPLEAHWNVSML